MLRTLLSSKGFMAILMTSMLFSTPAWADKKYKNKKNHKNYEQQDDRRYDNNNETNINVNIRFGDNDRVVIHDYYEDSGRMGRCPPGLRKKNNGCMPPGQAKKWRKGYPLPTTVIYHDLPPRIIVDIGLPPRGYKYIRVAADILLIAIGTGIVIDAIEDLGRI